ncbi:uncharacterized protein LOC133176040 [Saccostrea echinata]|uniref:uncharacterized protein LOC133176040 n=1 Tax=Saccostrea echinata TaxID=191078 RepID=UPI002A82145E|nr:uncharacterized protein LOC133176040 [Saccostrea echinata]
MTSQTFQFLCLSLLITWTKGQGADPSAVKECTEQGKCYWKGECKTPGRGRIWQEEEECADMWCHVYQFTKYISIRVDRFYGCRYKDQCRKKDEEWEEDGCVKRKCHIGGPRGYTRTITVSQLGCTDLKGVCHFPGSAWEENCVRYQCVNSRNGTSILAAQKIIWKGCPYNGSCLEEGSVVTDPDNKCITKRCVIDESKKGFYRVLELDTIKCEDANGICRNETETGWPLYIQGTLHNNCHCKVIRKDDGSVSIQKGCSN